MLYVCETVDRFNMSNVFFFMVFFGTRPSGLTGEVMS